MSGARPTSTARRVALAFAACVAILVPLLGTTTYLLARNAIERELALRIRGEMATLLQAEAREGRAALVADIRARDAAVDAEGGYLLTGTGGQRMAGSIATKPPVLGWSTVQFRGDRGEMVAGRALTVRLRDGTRLAVVEESGSLLRIERLLLAIVAIAFGLLLALTIGSGLTFGAILGRRLTMLDKAAGAIIAGDLARRMPVSVRNDEFDRLAITLNRMLDRLAALLDNLRHVSADIAHDLRTPLARLNGTLETAIAGQAAVREAALSRAMGQVQDLLSLFATILRISDIEAASALQRGEVVALDALVRDLGDAYLPAAQDDGRSLELRPRPAKTTGDRALLAHAVANLLDNALKHTAAGSGITLASGTTATGQPFVAVRDHGCGIPPQDQATALRRFGRLDAARVTPGHGLGLNLVSAVAAAHGASVRLEDAAPGLRVTLVFDGGAAAG